MDSLVREKMTCFYANTNLDATKKMGHDLLAMGHWFDKSSLIPIIRNRKITSISFVGTKQNAP